VIVSGYWLEVRTDAAVEQPAVIVDELRLVHPDDARALGTAACAMVSAFLQANGGMEGGAAVRLDQLEEIFARWVAMLVEEKRIAPGGPDFTHTACDHCTFLGHYREHDLYHCAQPSLGLATIIARYGDDGPEYLSCPVAIVPRPTAEEEEDLAILWEGRRRALKQFPQTFTLLS